MIIKGLFRRYETWNPVHPTTGAFWGMGIGVGCGVGWGPGFGHEVVGYVGAGCGVGFSVGITFAGIGVGLPTNCIIEAPYNALLSTKNCAWEFARSGGFVSFRNSAGDGWNSVASCLSGLNQEASERFSSFSHKQSLDRVNDLSNLRRVVAFHGKSILESLETRIARVSRPAKD